MCVCVCVVGGLNRFIGENAMALSTHQAKEKQNRKILKGKSHLRCSWLYAAQTNKTKEISDNSVSVFLSKRINKGSGKAECENGLLSHTILYTLISTVMPISDAPVQMLC